MQHCRITITTITTVTTVTRGCRMGLGVMVVTVVTVVFYNRISRNRGLSNVAHAHISDPSWRSAVLRMRRVLASSQASTSDLR